VSGSFQKFLKEYRVFSSGAFRALALAVILLISGCAAPKAEVKTYRSAGEMYHDALNEYFHVRYDDAEKLLKDLMHRYPLSDNALDAEILLADVFYANEKYDEARAYYTDFVALHPANPRAAYALFQKGMCYFRNVLTLDRDQASTKKALFAFEDLIREYPRSPYRARGDKLVAFLKRRLAGRELYIGRFYFKKKNFKGALSRFRAILKEYPKAGITDETLFYIGKSYLRLGEKNLARDAFTTLIKNYPESPFARDAGKRLEG